MLFSILRLRIQSCPLLTSLYKYFERILFIIHTYHGHTVECLVQSLCYKPGGSRFDFLLVCWIFQLIRALQPHYCTGVNRTSNRNEYQVLRFIVSLPSLSQLSRKCDSLDVSQPYRSPWFVTEVNLLRFLVFINQTTFNEASHLKSLSSYLNYFFSVLSPQRSGPYASHPQKKEHILLDAAISPFIDSSW
jgi:hypothetical protein